MATGTGPCVPKPIVTTNNKETNVNFLQAALAHPEPVIVIERYDAPMRAGAFRTDEAHQRHLDQFFSRPLSERRISVEVRTANWRLTP